MSYSLSHFFLKLRRPPRSTLTYTLFPYTTVFRSKRPEATGATDDRQDHWRLEGAGRQGGQGQGPDLADAGRHRGEAALHGGGRGRNGPGAPRLCAVYARGARIHVCGPPLRSEERRVGKEWFSKFRSRWSPYHSKKKKTY